MSEFESPCSRRDLHFHKLINDKRETINKFDNYHGMLRLVLRVSDSSYVRVLLKPS